MTIDRAALLQVFLEEAEETLDRLEAGLARLDDEPSDHGALADVFRALHTLKGDAGTVGFGALAQRAHHCEDLVEVFHASGRPLSGQALDLLFEASQDLRATLESETADGAPPEAEDLYQRIRASASESRPADSSEDDEAKGSVGAFARRQDARLAVSMERLNRLVELAAEVAVSRHRVGRMLSARLPAGEIEEAHGEADRLFEELQDLVMALRMVPAGRVFQRFRATVRNAAQAEGKRAKLRLEGTDQELDARLANALREPLTHLLRNAVAHGIESPEERQAAGKNATGTVTLEVGRERGMVSVRISDDGRGVDAAALAEKAGQSLDEVTPALLLDWMCRPGLSTRDRAGAVSGRGIGMDVVRRQIEGLRGSVGVRSEPGQGAEFRLLLPASLSLIDALEVAVGDETYLLPLESTERTLGVPRERLGDGTEGLLAVDGELLPWVRLRRRFAAPGRPAGRESVVLVHHGERRAGLIVDDLLGKSQHLIRPLTAQVVDVPALNGSSLLTDGRVALILDVPALLDSLPAPQPIPETSAEAHGPTL